MLLNRLEYLLMNNPIRAGIQRFYEAPRLLRMGGPLKGGKALEIGCGRGVGAELIFDLFGAASVDAFDLDPRMVEQARERLASRGDRVKLWVGDACAIQAPDSIYDYAFDFGIIHHIPDWRNALSEVYRVLKPGGVFYVEEILKLFLANTLIRKYLKHPEDDRFDMDDFCSGLENAGFEVTAKEDMMGMVGWFIARKPQAAPGQR